MILSNILSQINVNFTIKSSNKDINVDDINIDSRLVTQNCAFFALKGFTNDGNLFIKQAIDKGASVIISDQDFNDDILKNNSCVFINTTNCFELLIKFLQIFYYNLPQNIYAITGSNGKTSTAEFTRQILQLIDKKSASIGTLGVVCDKDVKEKLPESFLTTPDIVTMYKTLSVLKSNDINDVAIEFSSIGLEQKRIAGLFVNCAIFTNFSQDHLDYHNNMTEYFRCKMILFKDILAKNGLAVINFDITEYKEITKICQDTSKNIFSYGFNGNNLKIISIDHQDLGQQITINILDNYYKFKIKSSARFEAYNIICALAAIIGFYKLDKTKITNLIYKLENIESAAGRMERVAILPNHSQIFIDFAHSPDSLQKILKEIKLIAKNRVIVLFGCGGDRDITKRPKMGKIACTLADLVIISDDNPRSENPQTIRLDIIKGCNKNNFIEIGDRKAAIKKAISLLEDNDILVLAGKGHEKYQVIKDKKIHFDEKEIIMQELSSFTDNY